MEAASSDESHYDSEKYDWQDLTVVTCTKHAVYMCICTRKSAVDESLCCEEVKGLQRADPADHMVPE